MELRMSDVTVDWAEVLKVWSSPERNLIKGKEIRFICSRRRGCVCKLINSLSRWARAYDPS